MNCRPECLLCMTNPPEFASYSNLSARRAPTLLDDGRPLQRFDLVSMTEPRDDFSRVLAEQGSGRAYLARRVRELHGNPDDAELAGFRMVLLDDHLSGDDLLILDHPPDVVDRRDRHARLVQQLNPMLSRLGSKDLRNDRVQLGRVRGPLLAAAKARILVQM